MVQHGATCLPDNGHRIADPCRGARLAQPEVFEQNGSIFLK